MAFVDCVEQMSYGDVVRELVLRGQSIDRVGPAMARVHLCLELVKGVDRALHQAVRDEIGKRSTSGSAWDVDFEMRGDDSPWS